ncbi:MAG: hypothetical protein KKA07_14900 [Bacteroidetes bacterium]|nr:hypothetical protein [Bacteroidota bacterium]MBU1720349.1 hypothetical protein [Bacteroidota bacterium]
MSLKRLLIPLISLVSIIALSAFVSLKGNDLPRRNNNVCKKLTGNVLVYIMWAETRESYSWTDYDLHTTLDSIRRATRWVEAKAAEQGVNLKIVLEDYRNDTLKSVYQSMKGMRRVMSKTEGIDIMNKWGDRVIRRASGFKTKEKYIAHLRDENHVESVALLFFVNNYFKSDFAFSVNTTSDVDVEYSVISSKNPVIIAQEILHLFGAPYLFPHFSSKDRKNKKNLQEFFPEDIMAERDKDIDLLGVGAISRYYLSWVDEIDARHEKMVESERERF